MQSEAVFDNIAERIRQEISKSQKSVFIAVAWFTNKALFNELVIKAKNGCIVYLIISNDAINNNSSIDFSQLDIGKSKVYKIGNGDSELMHNKFCVIDYSTVITGSYNWSYKAENNFENVIITSCDMALAGQFITEFNNIRSQYYPEDVVSESPFPLVKVLKRLEIIKNYILLEDIAEVTKETTRLVEFDFNLDIYDIIFEIRNKEFASAINKIQQFINKSQQVSIWTDPEIAALKLEIKNLENQLNGFGNEKVEIEKLLLEFQHRHTIELGELIIAILKLRKLKYKSDKIKYGEAETDERQYKEQFEIEREKEMFELTFDQKAELKQKFRKATILCHPDKFANESEDIQKSAESIFKELNEANAKNDLQRVSDILLSLEKGILSTSKIDKLTDKDKLKATVSKLKAKVKILEMEIIEIKKSETYKTVLGIGNWDEYFKLTRDKLKNEYEALHIEVEV